MKVVRKVQKTVTEQELVDYICNKCGKSCCIDAGGSLDAYGLIEHRVSGGFLSPKLEDLREYVFSLCESCLWRMFESFQIPPHTHELMVAMEAELAGKPCCAFEDVPDTDKPMSRLTLVKETE